MKRILVCIAVLGASLLCLAQEVHAQPGRFGFGGIVGDPTGFWWNYRFAEGNSLNGALGFSPIRRTRLHVDYLWRSRPFRERNLSLTYGVGVAMGFGRDEYIVVARGNRVTTRYYDTNVGIRGPVGLNYLIPNSPVELGIEIAPILFVSAASDVGIDGGFGIRVYP